MSHSSNLALCWKCSEPLDEHYMCHCCGADNQAPREPGNDRLHAWWELSYAQYLTIPRTVMQSMPIEWQGRMADLLKELDDKIDWRPKDGIYWVELRKEAYDSFDREIKGAVMEDPLADYSQGRRQIAMKDGNFAPSLEEK